MKKCLKKFHSDFEWGKKFGKLDTTLDTYFVMIMLMPSPFAVAQIQIKTFWAFSLPLCPNDGRVILKLSFTNTVPLTFGLIKKYKLSQILGERRQNHNSIDSIAYSQPQNHDFYKDKTYQYWYYEGSLIAS